MQDCSRCDALPTFPPGVGGGIRRFMLHSPAPLTAALDAQIGVVAEGVEELEVASS